MYYTVYQITNLINNKIYIGTHITNELNDSYYGSGIYIVRAIKKYGKDNFKKQILFIFNNAEEMFSKELEIVNEEFVLDDNNYNLTIGGKGGWDYVNGNGLRQLPKPYYGKDNGMFGKKHSEETKEKMRHKKEGLYIGKENPFYGKKHSEETKEKIRNKVVTEETKEKMRNNHWSKKPGYIHPRSGKRKIKQ